MQWYFVTVYIQGRNHNDRLTNQSVRSMISILLTRVESKLLYNVKQAMVLLLTGYELSKKIERTVCENINTKTEKLLIHFVQGAKKTFFRPASPDVTPAFYIPE